MADMTANYIATIAVRFEIGADSLDAANAVANEKAKDLAAVAGDVVVGAFETEVIEVKREPGLAATARAFLDAFGGDVPDWLRKEARALEDALHSES